MAQIISVHSFRGGTGKSNLIANLAAVLALGGKRVGVVDTDIQSPGVHVLFGKSGADLDHALNDYLWGTCEIGETAIDVSASLGKSKGKLFLIPSSTKPGEITRILQEGYDVQALTRGVRDLISALELDVLFIDTHPGLNEETLLAIVIAHTLAIVMRPDAQDYEGTGIAVQVAHQLQVPDMGLVVNNVPASLGLDQVRAQVEETYDTPVFAVLPHSEELMSLASSGLFVRRHPEAALTQQYRELAASLTSRVGKPARVAVTGRPTR